MAKAAIRQTLDTQKGKSQLQTLFGFTRGKDYQTFNPTQIPLRVYDTMRNSPSVAAALSVVKRPIIGVDWKIRSENSEIADFVEENLRFLWADLIRDILTGIEFGFSALEKVLTLHPHPPQRYVYKRLLALDPLTVELKIRPEDGSLMGVVQRIGTEAVEIEAKDIMIYTHDEEFGNLYGRSRLRAAYQPWLYSMYMLQFAGVFYERYGMPSMVGFAPPGESNFKGEVMPNVVYMQRLLDSMQQASSITLPFTKDKKWAIEKLESERTGGDYIAMMRYLDERILSGIMVPHLAVS